MMELMDFQEEAVQHLYSGLREYGPFWRQDGGFPTRDERECILQLKLITGGGKTPIMASLLGRLPEDHGAIVLWTTPLAAVTDQTYENLFGKYNHFVSHSEIHDAGDLSIDTRRDILDRTEGLDIITSTVGMWNRADKESLNLTRTTVDGGESFWSQLATGRKRPLIVVYDEGHNASTAQIDRLGELRPSAYLVASASPLPAKLQPHPIEPIHIPARRVVENGLLKTSIEIGDYQHSWEARIEVVLDKLNVLSEGLQPQGISPKAIYVVEDSKERPLKIIDALIRMGANPDEIVLATKKDKDQVLPRGVIYAETLADMSGKSYKHIIFNKRLQEGWDDPEVYLAYIDQDSGSMTRITQIIGRVLRQPNGKHLTAEAYNTAYFILNCKEGNYSKVISSVRQYLENEGLSEIKVREEKEQPVKVSPSELRRLPKLLLTLERRLDEFKQAVQEVPMPLPADWCVSEGKATIQVINTDGELKGDANEINFGSNAQITLRDTVREALDESNAQVWPLINATWMQNNLWDQSFSRGSRAEKEIRERTVLKIIPIYNDCVDIELITSEFVWPEVGPIEQRPGDKLNFSNSLHPWYSNLNKDEIDAAEAIDEVGFPWIRNPARAKGSFAIPLPSPTEEGSRYFYPDFIIWLPDNSILAIEVKGKHLLTDALKTKLLGLPKGIHLSMVTRGKGRFYRKTTGEFSWEKDETFKASIIKAIEYACGVSNK